MSLLVLSIGVMVLGLIASFRLRNKFRKYSQIPLSSGMSGADAAMRMLRDYRVYDVQVICIPGELSDHYNPADKTVNLSEAVFYGRNAAAVAVAAHECGHAIQHATAYSFLEMRTKLVPVQNISSSIINFFFIASIFGVGVFNIFPVKIALMVMILLYGVITLFSLITLPVEIDASKRALAWVERNRVVNAEEYDLAKDALKWAAYTYVIAALGSLITLLHYVLSFIGVNDD